MPLIYGESFESYSGTIWAQSHIIHLVWQLQAVLSLAFLQYFYRGRENGSFSPPLSFPANAYFLPAARHFTAANPPANTWCCIFLQHLYVYVPYRTEIVNGSSDRLNQCVYDGGASSDPLFCWSFWSTVFLYHVFPLCFMAAILVAARPGLPEFTLLCRIFARSIWDGYKRNYNETDKIQPNSLLFYLYVRHYSVYCMSKNALIQFFPKEKTGGIEMSRPETPKAYSKD